MQSVSSRWRRTPVMVRSVFMGALMATLGVVPWSLLASLNIRYANDIPWVAAPALLFLWLYWHFATGAGWPRRGACRRRILCRANELTGEVWGSAMLAGILGLFAMLLFQGVMARLVHLPQQSTTELQATPLLTTVVLVILGALVAGIVEEVSFRGYMQGPLERKYGPIVAIVITGLLFGFAHFVHEEVTWVLLPYYMLIAANYGAIAWLTNSILPGIMLHAGGNMFAALMLFAGGHSTWHGTQAKQQPLVWETGADASFLISIIGLLMAATAAIWAFRSLADVVRKQ